MECTEIPNTQSNAHQQCLHRTAQIFQFHDTWVKLVNWIDTLEIASIIFLIDCLFGVGIHGHNKLNHQVFY